MAELGETCSHVGALLYYVEYQVRRHAETSSTSKPNVWLEPCAVNQAPYMHLEDINFTSAEQTMEEYRKPQQSPKAYHPSYLSMTNRIKVTFLNYIKSAHQLQV